MQEMLLVTGVISYSIGMFSLGFQFCKYGLDKDWRFKDD